MAASGVVKSDQIRERLKEELLGLNVAAGRESCQDGFKNGLTNKWILGPITSMGERKRQERREEQVW
jgi:hypothetical protein